MTTTPKKSTPPISVLIAYAARDEGVHCKHFLKIFGDCEGMQWDKLQSAWRDNARVLKLYGEPEITFNRWLWRCGENIVSVYIKGNPCEVEVKKHRMVAAYFGFEFCDGEEGDFELFFDTAGVSYADQDRYWGYDSDRVAVLGEIFLKSKCDYVKANLSPDQFYWRIKPTNGDGNG